MRNNSAFERELNKLEKLLDKLNKENRKNRRNMKGGDYEAVEAQMNSTAAAPGEVLGMPSMTAFGDRAGLVGQEGGAKRLVSKKVSEKRGAPRTFKVIMVDGKETNADHHAELYEKTKDGKDKKVSVTSVAKKVFRQLCRAAGKKEGCKMRFTIVETTKALDAEGHLVKYNPRTYVGDVQKKKKPTKRTLPDGRKIVNLYNYAVTYVPMEEAGVEMKGGLSNKKNVMNFYA